MARRNDHTRDELHAMMLAATRKLVAANGRHNVSARKIAREIGYTVGTIYIVFKDLDELLVHVNAQTVDELYTQLDHARNQNDPPEQQLLSLANAYILYAKQNRELWELAMQHRLTDGRQLPQWFHDKVNRLWGLVLQSMQSLRMDDQQRSITATALWSSVHGACVLSLANKLSFVGAPELEKVVETFIKQYLSSFPSS